MSAFCVGVPRHRVIFCQWRCRRHSAQLPFVTIGPWGSPCGIAPSGECHPPPQEKANRCGIGGC